MLLHGHRPSRQIQVFVLDASVTPLFDRALGLFHEGCTADGVTGLDWRTSSALGILMNTRGLMELIVLNMGLDLGIISLTLFAMMVLMSLATTLATTPILQRLNPT